MCVWAPVRLCTRTSGDVGERIGDRIAVRAGRCSVPLLLM